MCSKLVGQRAGADAVDQATPSSYVICFFGFPRARRFGVFVLYTARGRLFRFVLGEVTLVWTACALPEIIALRRETGDYHVNSVILIAVIPTARF
jgi:hypothetical protein